MTEKKLEKDDVIKTLASYTDLNKNDLDYVSTLIINDFPFDDEFLNTPWRMDMLLTASAYLYSKCPGNSDKVVDFKTTNEKLKQRHSSLSLVKGIQEVKELGFIPQYCVVTSTTVLRNMKREYAPRYKEIFNKAIEFSQTPEVKIKRQGRDPRVIAGACFYIVSHLIKKPVTQDSVSNMFNRTPTAIRSNYQLIAPQNFGIIRICISDLPRVQCKNCVHLGEKIPKVKRVGIFRWKEKTVRASSWRCLGNGNVHGDITSITYERICDKFQQIG